MTKKRFFFMTGFIIMTICAVLLPALFLNASFTSNFDVVHTVSGKNYNTSDSVLSQKASSKLSEYDQIRLISGIWQSKSAEAVDAQVKLTSLDALKLSKDILATLYKQKLYPFNLTSEYKHWYSWDTICYQATDTSFHTYSAFYWQVSFFRYDSDERHDILLSDSGTLLGIYNNRPGQMQTKTEAWKNQFTKYIHNAYIKEEHVNLFPITAGEPKDAILYPTFPDFTPKQKQADFALVLGNTSITSEYDLIHTASSDLPENTQIYEFYTCSDDENFALCMIPY